MFSKVLIANRGAIATRIIRTLNKMNIVSVAIYAESDRESLHVHQADESYSLGDGAAHETYLNVDKIIRIAKQSGAQAIHPGYGFLSENAEFVERCETEGLVFIGPSAEQMRLFGLKHKARELAQLAKVPLSPGTDLLVSLESALLAANDIGYPIMLKSTAGGGGIGMQLCYSAQELEKAFASVRRLSANNFANDGVFIEKFIPQARHIEVQVFGDGHGTAIAIGERDCSSQRRNQKVIEECPAPNLSEEVKKQLHLTAEQLLSSVNYGNAGTVEYIYDTDSEAFYFLEVNTRLQVEHGVTEEVYGIDLVEWMLRQAADEKIDLENYKKSIQARGHAIQVRLYAEDPYRDFQPSPGLLSHVFFPKAKGCRVDHWIESGIEISPYFDPMLAKVIVHDESRDKALKQLSQVLQQIELYGCETNLDYLRKLVCDTTIKEGKVYTRYLNTFNYQPSRIDVIQAGTQTSIQDYPGRTGYWDVGVPPSGPFDTYSFRLGNRLLENHTECAGLEITMQGPTLRFSQRTQIVLTGATIPAELDNQEIEMWQVLTIEAGQTLKLGRIKGAGARSYLCIKNGIQCPEYLGSRATFTLGQFGGHNGRALRAGDVLRLDPLDTEISAQQISTDLVPSIASEWTIRVIYGPHGAPDFFTEEDIQGFFEHAWEVHYNSSRTGVRLIGPKPKWARENGGEAGLHPSNIHDNAYAFGAIDFTGDMPVILGPDGPSLGGFVCPATVVQADLWKLGQLRAGDKIRFTPISVNSAVMLEQVQNASLQHLKPKQIDCPRATLSSPIVDTISSSISGVDVVFRVAGDHFLLVEYGPQELNIELRFRAHALMRHLKDINIDGISELTPGIRSLQVHYNSQILSLESLIEHIKLAELSLSKQVNQLSVPSRIVHIPLSWDDEACRQAIKKYSQSVRANAPWCPSNLEFIRRINGLQSIEAVKEIVFSASYLVMGLGDVYLGAPVATPIDPRHRLVTTKYNPARTWTAENSVGIGGSYLCVYGMEGPGGYQFIGRTLQMWNRYKQTSEFDQPWLLRFFDQIRFYEVSQEELLHIRKEFPHGRYPLKIEQTEFNLGDYQHFLASEKNAIDVFSQQRQKAFAEELRNWHANGQFHFESIEQTSTTSEIVWPEDSLLIESPVSGSVWKVEVMPNQTVSEGDVVMILESMKMEIPVHAPQAGKVSHILLAEGQRVDAGQTLIVFTDS